MTNSTLEEIDRQIAKLQEKRAAEVLYQQQYKDCEFSAHDDVHVLTSSGNIHETGFMSDPQAHNYEMYRRGLIAKTRQELIDHDRRRIIQATLRREANFVPEIGQKFVVISLSRNGELGFYYEYCQTLFQLRFIDMEDAQRIYKKHKADIDWLMGVE